MAIHERQDGLAGSMSHRSAACLLVQATIARWQRVQATITRWQLAASNTMIYRSRLATNNRMPGWREAGIPFTTTQNIRCNSLTSWTNTPGINSLTWPAWWEEVSSTTSLCLVSYRHLLIATWNDVTGGTSNCPTQSSNAPISYRSLSLFLFWQR